MGGECFSKRHSALCVPTWYACLQHIGSDGGKLDLLSKEEFP